METIYEVVEVIADVKSARNWVNWFDMLVREIHQDKERNKLI